MQARTKLVLTIAGVVLALVGAILLAGYWLLVVSDWPGGMRPSYDAKDQDPRLTETAATAAPLIAALGRYHAEHATFPADALELHALLVASGIAAGPPPGSKFGRVMEWSYVRTQGGTGYTISHSLGWDPNLAYRWDGTAGQWIFDPGDGSPHKPIDLKP